jgi:hypothetical protein
MRKIPRKKLHNSNNNGSKYERNKKENVSDKSGKECGSCVAQLA